MPAGGVHRFDITVPEGRWLRIEATPDEASDLILTLSRVGQSEVLLEVNEGWAGIPEILVYEATKENTLLRLEVIAPSHRAVGRYTLDTEFLETPDPRLQARARALLLTHRASAPPASHVEPQKAATIEQLLESAELWESIEQYASAARVLEELARLHGHEQPVRAIELMDRAIQHRQALGHRAKEGEDRNYRGLLRRQVGLKDEARNDFEAAAEIFTDLDHPRHLAAAINNLGLLIEDRGNFAGAQAAYQEAFNILGALTITGPMVDKQTATILDNMARLEMIQGSLPAAQRLLNRSMARREQANDPWGMAATQIELAWLEILVNRPVEALQILDQVQSALPHELPPSLAILLHDRRATALEKLGQAEAAWDAYQQAQQIALKTHDLESVAGISVNLCRLSVLHPQTQPSAPEDPCDEALELSRAHSDLNHLASSLFWRARNLEDRGHSEEALKLYQESFQVVDQMHTRVSGRDGRTLFFEDRSAPLRRWIDLSMTLHWEDPKDRTRAIRALEASERLRARGVLDTLSEARIDLTASADASLVEEEKSIRDKLAVLDSARRQWAAPKQQIDELIEVLSSRLDEIDQELRESNPWYQEAQPVEPMGIQDFQAELDTDSAFLSLLTGASRSYLWIIQREDVQIFELPRGQLLEQQAQQFLLALRKDDPYAAESTGSRIGKTLFGAQYERLQMEGIQRLVFVGDGALQQLPLSAIPLPDSDPLNPRFLVDTHEVTHLPSLSTLVLLRQLERPPPSRSIAILADPIYLLASHELLETLDPEALQNIFPNGTAETRLGRLRFTDLEARKVASYFSPDTQWIATKLLASRDSALDPQLANYGIVHFASHGWVDPDHPELSALLLSEVDTSGRKIDGRLRLQDIYRLNWRADLVVASACDTGVGSSFQLEGIGGLARGFFHAGVPRTIASLWSVDSESTAYLMDAFYDHLQTEGLPPGAALRQARLRLLRPKEDTGKTWGSPFHWGAFVLVGDWRHPNDSGMMAKDLASESSKN